MADDRIEVEIVLDDGSIQKGFAKMQDGAKKAGKGIESSLSGSFKRLLGPIAALGAAFAGAFAGKKIIQAAIAQQDAVNALAASLRNIGEAGRQADLERFASELQQVTKFGDEAIISQLAFAQAMGASADQSKEILKAATDMSAALNIDLNAAVRNISKTLGGYAGELGEVIPELKNLTQEQLRNGEGIELLAGKYQGFAQAEIKTFSGAIAQLENSFGDLLEKIGDLIIQNPMIINGINSLNKSITNISKNFQEVGTAIVTYVVAPLEFLFNVGDFVFKSLQTGFQSIVSGFGQIASAGARLLEFFGIEGKATIAMKQFGESSAQALSDMAMSSNESLNNIFDFNFSDKTQMFVNDLSAGLSEADSLVKRKADGIKQKVIDISKTVQTALSSSIKNGVAAIGSALARGENAWDAFGKVVLGIVGDMLINIGFAISGIGKAIEALKVSLTALSGGFAIVAGLALVALGGALKGLAGGAGGLGTAGGAAGGAPEAAPIAEPEIIEEDIQETGSSVVINVEGTVLDPAGVGQQIVDVLNEAGFTNGSRVIA